MLHGHASSFYMAASTHGLQGTLLCVCSHQCGTGYLLASGHLAGAGSSGWHFTTGKAAFHTLLCFVLYRCACCAAVHMRIAAGTVPVSKGHVDDIVGLLLIVVCLLLSPIVANCDGFQYVLLHIMSRRLCCSSQLLPMSATPCLLHVL